MSLVSVGDAQAPAVPATAATVGGPVSLREELETWQGAYELAKVIAPTEFVPKAMRNNPPAVMACILKAAELGVSALHGLSQIFIIDGRPGLYAELMRAMILARGHELWTEDYTQTRVTLCGRRKEGQHVQPVTWTIEDAKRAQLAGKPVWRQYPRSMLLARCTGELGRLMFADVLAGMSYTVEELTDGVDMPDIVAGGTDAAPEPPATHRRTTRRRSATGKAAAAPEGGPPAQSPTPGGPPPPLPDEEPDPVPSETGPQIAQDESPHQPPTATPERPAPPQGAADPGEPDEVVAKRAQAIAMRARQAGVDHHDVVAAVTQGRAASAKDLDAPTASAVLQAIVDIAAGRLELGQDEDGAWRLTALDADARPATQTEPASEDVTERLQNRVRDVQGKQAERRRGGQQALPTDPEEPA